MKLYDLIRIKTVETIDYLTDFFSDRFSGLSRLFPNYWIEEDPRHIRALDNQKAMLEAIANQKISDLTSRLHDQTEKANGLMAELQQTRSPDPETIYQRGVNTLRELAINSFLIVGPYNIIREVDEVGLKSLGMDINNIKGKKFKEFVETHISRKFRDTRAEGTYYTLMLPNKRLVSLGPYTPIRSNITGDNKEYGAIFRIQRHYLGTLSRHLKRTAKIVEREIEQRKLQT